MEKRVKALMISLKLPINCSCLALKKRNEGVFKYEIPKIQGIEGSTTFKYLHLKIQAIEGSTTFNNDGTNHKYLHK